MSDKNPKVEWYFNKESKWLESFIILRKILLSTELTEELKWGHPCYSLNGKNVVLMHGFKDYCALLFMKGVLLKDPEEILIQQTPYVQAARQIRFSSLEQLNGMIEIVTGYVENSIEIEKLGLEVALKKTDDFETAEEFETKLEEVPGLRDAFESLTPGRQRAYKLYFSSAKQSKTRAERVEKHIDRMLDGLGIDD